MELNIRDMTISKVNLEFSTNNGTTYHPITITTNQSEIIGMEEQKKLATDTNYLFKGFTASTQEEINTKGTLTIRA
jgi:hypothetical protein